LNALRAIARDDNPGKTLLMNIQEGLYLCTSCYRCTTVCPSGINLQDLWFNVREALLQKGHPELLVLSPLSFCRGLRSDAIQKDTYQEPITLARRATVDESKLMDMDDTIDDTALEESVKNVSLPDTTYQYCFACTTCTSSCPVVRNFENPLEALGMLPHQMIRAANFGLGDQIFDSDMLWSCLGCYECQDNCPQGVRITDVFYELKNLAIQKGKERSITLNP
jgi:heterodisulfide reductase subunit C